MQQAAPGNVLGQFVYRDAGFHTPDIRLAKHELVEGNVARGRECDLLSGIRHRAYSATGGRKLSLGLQPVTKRSAALFL
jgi:hypothetical protein